MNLIVSAAIVLLNPYVTVYMDQRKNLRDSYITHKF